MLRQKKILDVNALIFWSKTKIIPYSDLEMNPVSFYTNLCIAFAHSDYSNNWIETLMTRNAIIEYLRERRNIKKSRAYSVLEHLKKVGLVSYNDSYSNVKIYLDQKFITKCEECPKRPDLHFTIEQDKIISSYYETYDTDVVYTFDIHAKLVKAKGHSLGRLVSVLKSLKKNKNDTIVLFAKIICQNNQQEVDKLMSKIKNLIIRSKTQLAGTVSGDSDPSGGIKNATCGDSDKKEAKNNSQSGDSEGLKVGTVTENCGDSEGLKVGTHK